MANHKWTGRWNLTYFDDPYCTPYSDEDVNKWCAKMSESTGLRVSVVKYLDEVIADGIEPFEPVISVTGNIDDIKKFLAKEYCNLDDGVKLFEAFGFDNEDDFNKHQFTICD